MIAPVIFGVRKMQIGSEENLFHETLSLNIANDRRVLYRPNQKLNFLEWLIVYLSSSEMELINLDSANALIHQNRKKHSRAGIPNRNINLRIDRRNTNRRRK